MPDWDWNWFVGDSDTEEVSLLLSVRSQQLILSAMNKLDNRASWVEIEDATWDDIEEAISEAYEEIMETQMPDFTPVGTIAYYPSTTLPDKWLRCAGDHVEQGDYAELFALIGTVFGATAGTTFQLPDLQDRMVYATATSGQIAVVGGATTHTLTTAELPAHSHPMPHTHAQIGRLPGGAQPRVLTDNTAGGANITANNTGAVSTPDTSSVGSGGAHNNMPPYIRLVPMIKALP